MLTGTLLVCAVVSCSQLTPREPGASPAPSTGFGTPDPSPQVERAKATLDIAGSEPTPPPGVAPPPEPSPVYGRADLDPDNDAEVAPPPAVPDCEARLATLGVTYRMTELPVEDHRGQYSCGSHQAVVYLRGPGEARFSPVPVVDCNMALALPRLEAVLEDEARRVFGIGVRRISQMGTYSCRKMARYDWVSEHSYANAIDIDAIYLEDGRRISVLRHFGTSEPDGDSDIGAPARFLRRSARRLYDEGVFSVVLTPLFDRLHSNHFHLDLARYRVDGTR